MSETICGADCGLCPMQAACGGCRKTGGHPFGGNCVLAECCRDRGQTDCGACGGACATKAALIAEFNALHIPGLPPVTDLNALRGAFVNLEYTLPNGQKAKLLRDDDICLGNLFQTEDGTRCLGIAADDRYLLVCAFGPEGADAEVLLWKRRTP